jgi:hypothetical protein
MEEGGKKPEGGVWKAKSDSRLFLFFSLINQICLPLRTSALSFPFPRIPIPTSNAKLNFEIPFFICYFPNSPFCQQPSQPKRNPLLFDCQTQNIILNHKFK